MPTLDELQSQINILSNQYSQLSRTVNTNSTNIHNLDTRVDTVESKLENHENRIDTLETRVKDHENRLKLIEESRIKYKTSRQVMYPKKTEQGFYMYLPSDLTLDILREYNSGIINQKWNWVNKIFNPQGFGKVSFDLDRNEQGHIKAIVLGQNTRLVIPTGITFTEVLPVKSVLKAANETDNSINKGLVYGIEVLGINQEAVVSVYNPTSTTVILKAGNILVQVLHLFSYHTIPNKI